MPADWHVLMAIRPEPEIWHNVAIVHQRLGQGALAQQAYQQYQLTASLQSSEPSAGRVDGVQWVDPQTFSQVRSALAP